MNKSRSVCFRIMLFAFVMHVACVSIASFSAEMDRNLALSAKYEWNRMPNAFPHGYDGNTMCNDSNDCTQLTDGELADKGWWDKRSVGWWSDERVDIILDLKDEKAVDAVAFHLWSEKEGGRVPRQVLIFSSNDNRSFYYAGKMTSDETMRQWDQRLGTKRTRDNSSGWITKQGLQTRGRYIAISFWATSLYLDEIKVFSGGLTLDAVKLKEENKRDSLDVYPFVAYEKLHAAKEISLPVFLNMPTEIQTDPQGGLSLYVDLPDGILLRGPESSSRVEKITEGGQQWMRYKLKKARFLFLQSKLPIGTKSRARIIAADSDKGKGGRVQNLEIETISIPATPLPEKLRMSVGFAPLAFWLQWPEVVANYKHLGLNVFMPFCHVDPYWFFVRNNSQTVQARGLIKTAKESNLIVGAWTSPFCNDAIIGSDKNKNQTAVFLGSGKPSAVPCPRVYLDKENGSAWGPSGITQIEKGVSNGIEFYLFDSEPDWGGPICACPECCEKWKLFLKKRGEKYRDMNDIWKSKDRSGNLLLQEFWDEFYCELWGTFRLRMNKAAPEGSTVALGIYNYPHHANYEEQYFGNGGRFLPLYDKKILSFAAPENYVARTRDYGTIIRTWRQKLPQSCPIYPIVSCGGTNTIAWERSATDLKHRLFEIFCNGGQGFHCWSIGGATGDDLQAISQVIGAVSPYEDIIVESQPICDETFITEDKSMTIHGISNGRDALILVSRYNKNDQVTSKFKVNYNKLGFSFSQLTNVYNAQKVLLEEDFVTIPFDGTLEDAVKVFYIKNDRHQN